ncbi:MAG: hypothetical protein OEU84_16835 [Xanthomonadales bacterium]|nr:hypothetical protein [Xanthomonadales bacterium]MDH4021260.1 hypothetical protein [Xanthomonadales bacterium]
MNKVVSFTKIFLIIPLALAIASYATVVSQELLDDYYYSGPKVLVDASRDGGTWWAPQWEEEGGFNPDLYHQGKHLADHLRSLGMRVTELPRPFNITAELLNDFDLVIRANAYPKNSYDPDEIDSYQQYVANGGALILLADFTSTDDPDQLALNFGLNLQGNLTATVDSFTEHPITSGLQPFVFHAGSILVEDPPTDTLELGFIGSHTAMGLLPYGFGQIFFIGDTAEVTFARQPLTENLFVYFLSIEGLASQVLFADLDADAESGLLDKLEAALSSHDDGRLIPMNNQLQAFINQVEALRLSGRVDSVVADQLIGSAINLMSNDQGVAEPGCPCWSPEDIAALPMKKTSAFCISDGSRLDIYQEGECEHSFGVSIDANGDLSCVANRFDCRKLPDLGGEFIATSEGEFQVCMNQIFSRCEELDITPPDYP